MNKIKRLEIQGARNIAKAAVGAIVLESNSFDGGDRSAYISSLLVCADELASARPTEPMLRNYLKYMLARITGADNTSVSHMQKIARDLEKKIYDEMEQSKGLIADYGSQLILNGSRCYTHCHSSTVTGIFKEAYDDGKDFSVVVSETRPLFQGLKTAKELSSHGIPTTLIVDSAASVYLKKCDCVLVGADAVSASGDLVNKIGTSTIAHFSAVYGIPFYCAAELYKFDHLTKWGMIEPIEHRNSDEVYKGAKSKLLSIDNLAFDLTPARYISAYVTEKGIIPPQSLLFLTK